MGQAASQTRLDRSNQASPANSVASEGEVVLSPSIDVISAGTNAG
jgi:hypothetical protein